MLEKSLHKMINEQFVEWAKCCVLDMIQVEMKVVNICIAVGKGSYAVIVLCRELKFLGMTASIVQSTHVGIYPKFIVVPCIM